MKSNMKRNINFVRTGIKAPVPMVRGAVSNKDIRSGPKIHFMLIVSTKMGKAPTPKDFEKREIRLTLKKMLKG